MAYRLNSDQIARRRAIVGRRRAGQSFVEIGKSMSITRQAVHQLYHEEVIREHREGIHRRNYVQDCGICCALGEYD